MMLPAVLLIRARRRPRVWIPVPLFLLWPFWLLGWLVWAPTRLLHAGSAHVLRTGLILLAQLSGLELDADTRDGTSIHFRFV